MAPAFPNAADHDAYVQMRQRAVARLAEVEQQPDPRPRPLEWIRPHPFTTPEGHPSSARDEYKARSLRTAITGHVQEDRYDRTTRDTLEPCTKGDDNSNSVEINYLEAMNRRIDAITAAANAVDATTRDNTRLASMIEEYDGNIRWMFLVVCYPSFPYFDKTLQKNYRIVAACILVIIKAMDLLFANATQALRDLQGAFLAVRDQRTAFETAADGAGGVAAITSKHQAFLVLLERCKLFRLVVIAVDDQVYDPSEYYQQLQQIEDDERHYASIDELDQLRDEYVQKFLPLKLWVPRPYEFSQTKCSRRFTFAQLNVTNDYTWAVLTDILLQKVDSIADAMDQQGYQIQLNSVYRNPFRSDGRSMHQYGRACDWQVFDFDHNGTVDEHDWQLLRDLIATFYPSYIEPMDQSGKGHIHADWRPPQDAPPGPDQPADV